MKSLISSLSILFQFIFINQLNAQSDAVSADGDAIVYTQKGSSELSLKSNPSFSDLDPGDAIEGDYIKDMDFYNSGQNLLTCNFVTQNVSKIDFSTRQVIGNIELGGGPVYIESFGINRAIVTLPLTDETLILDLVNDSVLARISTPGEPNVIQLDEANNRAFISSQGNQLVYEIDLSTNTIISSIDSVFSGIQTFSFITSNNRSDFEYYNFLVSADKNKVIAIDHDGEGISIHDIASGNIDTSFDQISDPFAMVMSDSSFAFVLNNWSSPTIYRINLNDFSLDSIVFLGQSLFSLCNEIVSDPQGEKLVLCLSNGIHIANFNSLTSSQISSNTVFWLQANPDGQFVTGGGYYTQIVDMINESILLSTFGLSASRGVVADSGLHFVSIDPLRKEYLHAYSFTPSTVISNLGDINPGSQKEADAPYRVSISPDGSKVLVSNQLSKSASIIDSDSMKVNYLVDGMLTGSFGNAITSDGKYGLIADYEGFKIHVIHLESGQLVASPSVGDRPSIIRIAPGDSIALVTNTRANSVSFVRLDSANSANISNVFTGTIGVSWTNQGIFSDLQILPNGNYAMLAVSFSDQVQIIDMNQRSVVKSINVGAFPTQIAFNFDGSIAAVLNKTDNTFSLLSVLGPLTSVVGTYPTGQNPSRIDYNEVTDHFVICNSGNQSIQLFDAATATLSSTLNFAPNYSPIQSVSLPSGLNGYLLAASGSNTTSVLRVDGIDYPLPSRPCFMAASSNSEKIAICMSGPDYVSIFSGDTLLSTNLVDFGEIGDVTVFPNPGKGYFNIKLNESFTGELELCTIEGKLLQKNSVKNQSNFGIEVSSDFKGLAILRFKSTNPSLKINSQILMIE